MRGKVITLEVSLRDTIGSVKAAMQDKEGIPADHQRLLFGHTPLQSSDTLLEAGVHDCSRLLLVQRSYSG